MEDTSEDNGHLPSAKVRPQDRKGIDGWIRFHAAYSRRFASAALQRIADPGDLVLDPFCGSGTTARAAACVGCPSLSLDLNPALIAAAKASLVTKAGANSIIRALRRVNGPDDGDKEPSYNGITEQWLHPETANSLEYYRRIFLDSRRIPDGRAFGLGLLVSSAQEIVQPETGSNPTWPKPPQRRHNRDVQKILLSQAMDLRRDLARFRSAVSEANHSFGLGDAKNLPLPDESVDAVITSPPYLSRLDYIRATLPELLAIGYGNSQDIRSLRESLMGGVLTERDAEDTWPGWGPTVEDCLESIESHESKASDTYYKTLARRYFADLDESISEVVRVLKPGKTAIFVVQTSYYKDVEIPLPEIVVEIGEGHGATCEILDSEQVLQHLGRLSPHQRDYVPEKSLEEAIVKIRGPS